MTRGRVRIEGQIADGSLLTVGSSPYPKDAAATPLGSALISRKVNLTLRTLSCGALSFTNGFHAFRVAPLRRHLTRGSPKEQ